MSVLFFTGYFKTNHSIGIKNSFLQPFSNVSIDKTSYGAIIVSGITDYKPIDEGDFTISGTTASGNQLSGGGNVKGKGKHKWTMTITAAGGVDFKED